MLQSAIVKSFDDDQFLLAAQAGNPITRDAILLRFHRLLRALIRKFCPHRSAHQPDFVDDVMGETYRMILDAHVTRFDASRGSAGAYLSGLVRNAVRIVTRQRKAVCDRCDVSPVTPGPVVVGCRNAAVVYHNLMGNRTITNPATAFEIQEQMAAAFDGADLVTAAMVIARHVQDAGLAEIASRYGVSHTTVSRNIQHFLADRCRQLALAGAA